MGLPAPELSDPYLAHYVAAMVELVAHRRDVHPPFWTSHIEPLREPVFAVPWQNLRAHLLLNLPMRSGAEIFSSIPASGRASDVHGATYMGAIREVE